MTRRATLGVAILALAVTGCPIVSSQGVDLGTRGILSLLISRETTSASVSAGASVRDNAAFLTLLNLADDQILSVNGTALRSTLVATLFGIGAENTQVAASVGAVDTPDTYTITFDNQGETASMTMTPPTDFTAVTPAAGAQVSKTGFTVTWAPSGEADVSVDIIIEGLEADGDDDDADADTSFVRLSNLADNGTVAVGASDLTSLLTRSVTLTVKRFRSSTQSLGFTSGDVRVEVFQDIAVTLTN